VRFLLPSTARLCTIENRLVSGFNARKIFGFSGLICSCRRLAAFSRRASLHWWRGHTVPWRLLAALMLPSRRSAPLSTATYHHSLLILCSCWGMGVSVATERASLRWLLIAAVVVGLGFNIRVCSVPWCAAFVLIYLLGRGFRAQTDLHLALAGVVLLVVSFSWVAIVT